MFRVGAKVKSKKTGKILTVGGWNESKTEIYFKEGGWNYANEFEYIPPSKLDKILA